MTESISVGDKVIVCDELLTIITNIYHCRDKDGEYDQYHFLTQDGSDKWELKDAIKLYHENFR